MDVLSDLGSILLQVLSFFVEFACLMTKVQRENEGGSAKSAKRERHLKHLDLFV